MEQSLFLTSQEHSFCSHMAQGYPPASAAKMVGVSDKKVWMGWLENPQVKETLARLKQNVEDYLGVEINRDMLNGMLLEAHATAATSTEKISAVRELGKMNGLYEAEKKEVLLQTQAAEKVSQLEGLSDEELVQRAGLRTSLKNDVVTDAEYTEIANEEA